MNHEELVELLQEGKIGYLRFVLEGERTDRTIWSGAVRTAQTLRTSPPSFYVEQTDIMQMERQLIDDEDYGIWN